MIECTPTEHHIRQAQRLVAVDKAQLEQGVKTLLLAVVDQADAKEDPQFIAAFQEAITPVLTGVMTSILDDRVRWITETFTLEETEELADAFETDAYGKYLLKSLERAPENNAKVTAAVMSALPSLICGMMGIEGDASVGQALMDGETVFAKNTEGDGFVVFPKRTPSDPDATE